MTQAQTQLKCCGISFNDSQEFARHKAAAHHNAALTCCNISFKNAEELAQHMRSAHGAA